VRLSRPTTKRVSEAGRTVFEGSNNATGASIDVASGRVAAHGAGLRGRGAARFSGSAACAGFLAAAPSPSDDGVGHPYHSVRILRQGLRLTCAWRLGPANAPAVEYLGTHSSGTMISYDSVSLQFGRQPGLSGRRRTIKRPRRKYRPFGAVAPARVRVFRPWRDRCT